MDNRKPKESKVLVSIVKTIGLFTLIIFFSCTTVYSQEKYRGSFEFERQKEQQENYQTSMQKGAQVIEQVNVIEGGEMIGNIDWENRYIFAVGDGVMPPDAISPAQARVRAKRAAIDEAFGRLIEMANEVRVDAESTTRNYVNENRVVRTKVRGIVKHAEIVKINQLSDGSFQVMMRMPMDGAKGLSSALLPVQLEKIRKVRVVSSVSRENMTKRPSASMSDSKSMSKSSAHKAENYTGLIIDARGLKAKPVMYPKVLTESGETVYSVESANPNATIEEGLVAYRKSLDAAKQVSRIGNNPLIIKAKKVAGTFKSDVVISDSDAEKIYRADSKGGILGEAKVVVVID